ncbi:MAG: peptide deformylase [Elusimicrobia bacterium RIFOXYA2_FULL_40_6]|nr:MAG: peptide deformylase [Elusimicrobia bacterium RIFOXYA2_FULL_40_6]
MAILPIVKYPDPVLRKKTKIVKSINAQTKKLIKDMSDTLKNAKGLGLAANQVGVPLKILIISIPDENKNQVELVLINPKIIQKKGCCSQEEGCLSFPGLYLAIKRAKSVKVKAVNDKGQIIELTGDDLLARVFQHEIDHLEGKQFIDRLSILTKLKAKSEIKRRIKAGTW